MRFGLFVLLVLVLAAACATKPPPPIVCEPPPPQLKSGMTLGMCPVSYADVGAVADSDSDTGYDAPR